ncbi:MAG: DUF4830 domain-containing protein [Pseudoflavonifractor sp.]
MFIFTAKLRRRHLVLGGAAALLLCGAVALAAGLLGRSTAPTLASGISPKNLKTGEDRVAYLGGYGWTVVPEPLAVEELIIPKEFDASYDEYLALQSAQGFDLTQYRGKRVKRFAYAITNYPTGETDVQAGLLVYKNKVIGGEILSGQAGGFLHGLSMPE